MSMLLVFPFMGHQSDQLRQFGIVCVTRSLLITRSPYHSDTLPVHSSRYWCECTTRITPRTSISVDLSSLAASSIPWHDSDVYSCYNHYT